MSGAFRRSARFERKIPHVKATGKLTFFQRVPRANPTAHRHETARGTVPQRDLGGVQVSATCHKPSDLQARATAPTTRRDRQTNRQTDRQTDFVPLVSKRQATLSLALLSEIHMLFCNIVIF